MSRKAIRVDVLKKVVADQGRTFSTRDVSEDNRVRLAHAVLVEHGLYHGFVGGALSDHRIALGIVEIQKNTSRGSRWEKLGVGAGRGDPQDQGPDPVPSSRTGGNTEAAPCDLGPQHKGDSPFMARMRLHQSWYRANILQVPCGTGPTRSSTNRFGNMLAAEDGTAGLNFLTPEIFQVVQQRLTQWTDRVEPFRLLHNMLSSQPMCFNLFGPLVQDHDLSRRLMEPILGKVARINNFSIASLRSNMAA